MKPLPEPTLEMVSLAQSMFARGYSFGTAGNLSVRVDDRIYATPTGSSFGTLTAEGLAICDLDGAVIGTHKPTKEISFHLAAYRARISARAVVHLHSTYATAVASLQDVDEANALPAITAYYAMRVPLLPVVRYLPLGDPGLAEDVGRFAEYTPAMLMKNHGSIAIGASIHEAAALAEEIEEAARLFFILGDRMRPLSSLEIAELHRRFR